VIDEEAYLVEGIKSGGGDKFSGDDVLTLCKKSWAITTGSVDYSDYRLDRLNGKTTSKELLHWPLLNAKFKTLATSGISKSHRLSAFDLATDQTLSP